MNWKKYLLGVRLLLLCLTLGFAACSDDDMPNEEQQIEQELADAAAFWNVVGQLTDDVMPDEGWQKATYAPSIGEADGTNSTMRIVQCADAENAAESFADLVGLTYGKDITADTPEYTYKNDLVGTLTYRRTSGETLATVDVDIAQMPGLQQIVYRQVVENASFSGTAYYRFGDVVAKQNADGQTDYWICVRPAFGPAGKGDSHWISLSKIPSANVKTVNKTVSGQKLTHVMPKSLCTNQEHMQNLAEMLYAMLFPAQWAKNLETNNGYKTLKYFKDFDYKKLFKYHNDSYFRMVDNRWNDFYVAVFGLTAAELREELQTNGLNLIYGTATMSGNNISLPMATFYQTNLKTKVLSKKTSTWDKQSFNIYDLTKNGYAEFTNAAGGSEKAWVVRYATGATLAKGSAENPVFDKQKKLPNCSDVKVYNLDVDHLDMSLDNLKKTEPRVAGAGNDEPTYYHCGDIVRYQNRYYVCVSKHSVNGTARFITLNDQETHTTGTCNWSGYGDDVVYNDDMASSETLAAWIQNILMDDTRWTEILGVMQDRGLSNYTLQLVPQNEVLREDFVSGLFYAQNVIPECFKQDPLNNYNIPITAYRFDYLPEIDGNSGLLCGVAEKLLADKFRWAFFAIGSNEYWVPYVVCITDNHYEEITKYISECASQSDSHFQWKTLARSIPNTSNVTKKTNYNIVLLAMHWEHTTFFEVNSNYYALLDFTKDWLNHPESMPRKRYEDNPDLWGRRCITSRELTFTDNGQQQYQLQSVWVAKER
jgi:hypothetical protein